MAVGTATVDFGASPGLVHATVAVTGQGGIVSGSRVEAWVRPEATLDHSADETLEEQLRVTAATIVAGTGFTIYVECRLGLARGQFSIDWVWN